MSQNVHLYAYNVTPIILFKLEQESILLLTSWQNLNVNGIEYQNRFWPYKLDFVITNKKNWLEVEEKERLLKLEEFNPNKARL